MLKSGQAILELVRVLFYQKLHHVRAVPDVAHVPVNPGDSAVPPSPAIL
jgi:hypothetical protein